jgi:hypothetical protein
MDVSSQHHASAILLSEKEPTVPIEEEAEWASKLIWIWY